MENDQKTNSYIIKLEKNLSSKKLPYLSKVLKHLKPFLYNFISLYNNINVKYDMYPRIENKCYKFIYEDIMVNKLKIDKTTISKKINILATLGLIEKLNIYSQKYNHANINIALNKAYTHKSKSVIFFYIPNCTYKILFSANERAQQLIENNYTIKYFSKQMIINIFGQSFADEIFLDKRTIPKYYYNQYNDVKHNLMKEIEKNSLMTFSSLKEEIFTQHSKKHKFTKINLDNLIQNVTNELIKNKIIEKRRLNKQEKKLHHIDKKDFNYYILKGKEWKNG